MLLFSRIVTLNGGPRRIMPWVGEITAYVNANSSLEVTAWAGTFGHPIGTVAWSAIVDSEASLSAATGALLGQGAYLDLVEGAADMITVPGHDLLRQIVHGEPSDPPPLGAVARIVTATAVLSRFGDAITWGLDMAQYMEKLNAVPTAVLTDVFGTMGAITFITIAADSATSDTQRERRGDDGYMSRLAVTKDLFLEGSVQVQQATRVA